VAPEIREYERVSTTVINAYIKPLANRYIAAPLLLMLSNGGLTNIAEAKRTPVQLLESGPAAGALVAAHLGAVDGGKHVLAFDMGGTIAKLSIVDDGKPTVAYSFEAAREKRFVEGSGLPVRISTLELIEIGAGGGSIAHLDDISLLKVGPTLPDGCAPAITRLADIRYVGQASELVVPLPAGPYTAASRAALMQAFEASYVAAFTRTPPTTQVEIINMRVSASIEIATGAAPPAAARTPPTQDAAAGTAAAAGSGTPQSQVHAGALPAPPASATRVDPIKGRRPVYFPSCASSEPPPSTTATRSCPGRPSTAPPSSRSANPPSSSAPAAASRSPQAATSSWPSGEGAMQRSKLHGPVAELHPND
jgi:N-methylhydantoinase A/oxoprolinase/acetone carboxylase beta subunit